jgi:hypothetical protein
MHGAGKLLVIVSYLLTGQPGVLWIGGFPLPILPVQKGQLYVTGGGGVGVYISPPDSSWTHGAFYIYLYNHAHRLRLEKLIYLELS